MPAFSRLSQPPLVGTNNPDPVWQLTEPGMELLRQLLETDCRQGLVQMKGQVWPLSKNSLEGSRLVQNALQKAREEVQGWWLLKELRGHVLAASRCPNANHVLRYIVTHMPLEDVKEFVLDVLEGHLEQVCLNKYGCRIVCDLVKHCAASPDVNEMVNKILQQHFKSL
eukprot:6489261-Amphidinium_carterae.1